VVIFVNLAIIFILIMPVNIKLEQIYFFVCSESSQL
jgi:hypothetical protein